MLLLLAAEYCPRYCRLFFQIHCFSSRVLVIAAAYMLFFANCNYLLQKEGCNPYKLLITYLLPLLQNSVALLEYKLMLTVAEREYMLPLHTVHIAVLMPLIFVPMLIAVHHVLLLLAVTASRVSCLLNDIAVLDHVLAIAAC